MLTERSINLVCALFLIIFSIIMLNQLDGLAPEGKIFPEYTVYLLIGSSALLALCSLKANGEVSFFGKIPPVKWCIICVLFLCEIFGAMYISFMLSMSAGMFLMLLVLKPDFTFINIGSDILFIAGFILFFKLFFVSLMHIYFPEFLF